jgi:hypothetical protein
MILVLEKSMEGCCIELTFPLKFATMYLYPLWEKNISVCVQERCV